ncbi:hypothetical protein BV25DRAFT_1099128 [Artomyces pyxidatus]|uniref:Uncharacterized protein n=1 Tax=Artomyces pyxidatus TaxID=48021 RepID=A0ACB8TG34_9AGAM|nr:hypothetical protein BV25DRAFT_1099128 [Artomyces pyxidatus]
MASTNADIGSERYRILDRASANPDQQYWEAFYSGSSSRRRYYSSEGPLAEEESSQSLEHPKLGQPSSPPTPSLSPPIRPLSPPQRHKAHPRARAAYTAPPSSSPLRDAGWRSIAPPTPGSPSPSYLDLSLTPSETLSEQTRKLLVLDLNGSLLLRSARPPRPPRNAPISAPLPRKVYRRPYLTALCAYLFSQETRKWLDVMVWSSAQPHNVDDMVQHSFGEDRSYLLAVWARDTLGLAEDHYHRKIQTVKDLSKPWKAMPSLMIPASPASLHPSIASSSSPSPPGSPPPLSTTLRADDRPHSASTTLLLDDSPLKAVLQPYNHLCIPEYTQAMRNNDIAELDRAKSLQAALERAHESPNTAGDTTESAIPAEELAEDATATRKRKRKEQKLRKAEARRAQAQAERDTSSSTESPEPQLDQTLLAVIGILHTVRRQSNVAGWIRSGGTWGPQADAKLGAGNDEVAEEKRQRMWFEDPLTVAFWAAEGRSAMAEQGLPLEHGIER